MQAAILIYPGAEELDVFAPYEVLRVAKEFGAPIETSLVSAGDLGPVRLAKGSTVLPHRLYSDGPIPDLLIIPGGGWASRAAAGMRSVVEDSAMLAIVRTAHAAGAIVASICTGAMLLSRAGLLAGRPATTHHAAIDDLRSEGAVIVPARIVDAGSIITCGGVTSGLDLALALVERFADAEIAVQTERYLEYDRRGTVWRQGQG